MTQKTEEQKEASEAEQENLVETHGDQGQFDHSCVILWSDSGVDILPKFSKLCPHTW